MRKRLFEIIHSITSLDPSLSGQAKKRLDSLTKPLGSLGQLEDMARKLYSIQKGKVPLKALPARMYTIAADHGVVEEGVASMPQTVTVEMVKNFLVGGAGINVLCDTAGAEVIVVDAGVNANLEPHDRLIQRKIAYGTANMCKGAAMTEEECVQALLLGIELAQQAKVDGIVAVGMGEMGIGNTTPSSALFCALFGFTPEEVTGMGAGFPPKGLVHKVAVIKKALLANKEAVQSGDTLRILAGVGGLEIAALAGLVIGGAACNLAIMVDGFIATAAYSCAMQLAPRVKEYCFFCHGSAEAGHKRILERLEERPLLDLGLRLGEGSGAALGFYLLKVSANIFNDMATFDEAGVDIHL